MPETNLLEKQLRSWFGSRRIEALRTIDKYLLQSGQDYYMTHGAQRMTILPHVRSSAAGMGWTSSFDEQAVALKLLGNIGEKSDREYLKYFFEEKVTPRSQIVSHDLTDWATETVGWTEYAYPNSTGPISKMLFYCDGERAEIDRTTYVIEMKTYPKDGTVHKVRADILETLRDWKRCENDRSF